MSLFKEMDHHYSSVVERTTHESPSKMGSNNGYVVGGAYGNCNGVDAGVIMSSSSTLGKQQFESSHSIVADDPDLSVHQHPTIQSLHSTSHHINPKDVAQVMCARNGHIKNCSSMDHHPATRNMIRPDIHPGVVQSHQHHFQLPSINHQHQATMITGSTMAGGGVIVDRDYAPENQMFRTPVSMAPGGMNSHPYAISSGEPAMPPDSSPTSNSSYGDVTKSFGRKRSRKRPKTCGVCSDRAKSFHFGGLSCDSCKAFFRRSVQNDAHVAFRCAYDSCCDINISTRKSCQFCRFKKCLSIGMEKSWVMTEEERNALNQQRLEKKHHKPTQGAAPSTVPTVAQPVQQQQQLQQPPHPQPTSSTSSASSSTSSIPPPQTQSYTFQSKGESPNSKEASALAFQETEYVADVEKMLDYMTADEQQEIKTVVEAYLHAYKEMPFRVSFEEGRRDTLEIIEMFTTILRRFAYFAKLSADFSDINRGDQANLLRAAVLEMCLLRGAACFDTENNRWPSSTMESLKDCPQLRVEDMQRLVSRELFEMHITFIFHMKRLRIDEPIAMLLIMTVLFSPERIPVEDKVKINRSQEKYLFLLKKYVSWKFGHTAGSKIYPQLLTKLSDLRQLNDFHTEFHLNLDRKEVNAIRKSLMELHLNPYPNWKIVPESHQSSPEDSRDSTSSQAAATTGSPAGAMSMPMVTQALIQSFADRRIPTLLDNPYATFETDLGMIRQVQQTLGSLFPSGNLSSSLLNDAQGQQSTDSENTNTRNLNDSLLSSEKSVLRPSSISPRGYSSSTDSADGQTFDASRYREYQTTSMGDSSSSSTHMDGPLLSTNEYHSDRFQQFLTMSGQDSESVIKQLSPSSSSSTTTAQSFINSGSQLTVLRKHSSSAGTSLPGAPSSVIRSAPARQVDSSGVSQSLEDAHNPMRSINCGAVPGAGWHGGEVVHTPINGHLEGSSGSTAFTVARSQPSLYDDEGFSDED